MSKNVYTLARSILIFLCFIGFVSQLYSQKPIEVKPSIYMDSLKRLYVKDSMPMYFFMSYSNDKNQAVLLQSDNPHSNPMYFDGDGNHFIKHQDNYLEEYVEFHIFNDGKAPVTTMELSKKNVLIKEMLFTSANVEITLKSKDLLSGVSNVYYSIDGAPYTAYTGSFKLTGEKEYIIKYYAVDNVGNMEKPISKNVIVDMSAPITSYSIDKDYSNNVLSLRSSISLAANDATGIAKIYYSIDNDAEKVYLLPLKTILMTEGEHTLTYYSVDLLDNKEAPKTFTFFIDKTPPIVVEELEGSNYVVGGKEYASGRSKVKLTAIDNKAGVKSIFYSVNNGVYMQYSVPFYLSTDKAGVLYLKTYAIDNVNNKADNTQGGNKMSIPYVDLTGPTLSFLIEGTSFKNQDSLVICKGSKVVLKAVDPEAGLNRITYILNKNTEVEYNAPISVDKEGYYTLAFTGYDNVDNSSSKVISFSMDNTGPDIYTRFSISLKGKKKEINGKNLDVYPSHVILFLSATDLFVGIQKIFYTINSDIEKPYDKMISGFAKGKAYHVKIKAIDMLGNATESEIDFYIE
jgi:hypothetical protein